MNRLQFYKAVNADVGDGVLRAELDFLDNSLVGLTVKRRPMYYRVTQGDLQAPDNIAFGAYKDERLWWVICLANNIDSPCADIDVGDLLLIPDILDIYDFFKTNRKR